MYESAAFNFAKSLRIAEEMGNKMMISCALDGFAALAIKNGNAEQSAKLAGAAENLRESIGYQIEPAEEIFRANYLKKVCTALNEKKFAALYEQGKTMNLDASIAFVKVFDSEFISDFDAETVEIVIENHSFSRIIIEEEIENYS